MPSFYAFAGPYLEILMPPGDYPPNGVPGWEEEDQDKLLEPSDRLRWLNGRGDLKDVVIAGRFV